MSDLTPEQRETLVRFFHNEGDGGIWEHFNRFNSERVTDALAPVVAQMLAGAWDEGHRAALDLFPARPEDNPWRQA